MIDVKEFQRLKASVDRLKSEADRAEGAHVEHMRRLEKEFGCKNLAAAKKLLESLDRKARIADKKYRKLLDDFHAKWDDTLEGV